jgi:hypothetical protein
MESNMPEVKTRNLMLQSANHDSTGSTGDGGSLARGK